MFMFVFFAGRLRSSSSALSFTMPGPGPEYRGIHLGGRRCPPEKAYDLVPNLAEAVRAYAAHERGLFDKLSEARLPPPVRRPRRRRQRPRTP